MRFMWAVALFLMGCSSASGAADGGGVPAEAGGEDAPVAVEAAAEAAMPEAAATEAGSDASPDVDAADEPIDDSGNSSAFDGTPIGSDGAACPGNDPGDGGTWCTLYAFQLDGAPLDEAGDPNGISVHEACTVGQPCTACVGGYGYAGVCE